MSRTKKNKEKRHMVVIMPFKGKLKAVERDCSENLVERYRLLGYEIFEKDLSLIEALSLAQLFQEEQDELERQKEKTQECEKEKVKKIVTQEKFEGKKIKKNTKKVV